MKRRIFLLEDDESLSKLIRIKLQRAGFDVVAFFTANEAYEYISVEPEGLLLADYLLPDMNCDTLINKLISINITIPFIVMTGLEDRNLIIEMMRKGAANFIVKNLGFVDTLPGVVLRVYDNMLTRKALEQSIESIKQNELKLRVFFENIQDIFFVLDKYGKIIEISPSVEKVLGYKMHEIIGKRIKKIFADKSEFSLLFGELQHNNSVALRKINAVHKNRNIVYLSVSINNINIHGKETQVIGIARDVSDKRISDAEVMKKVMEAEERERKKLADAIHDDLGPMMSVMKMYFELINKTGDNNEKRDKLLKKVSEVIDSAIQKTRTITTSLTSNVLDANGLKTAVEMFAESISFASGIRFDIQIIYKDISKAMEIFLYRASVELINNTIKHSGADEVYINIKQTPQALVFQYRDNGCGFNSGSLDQPGKIKGHGLLSIINKVSIMSGYCSMVSEPGSGTKVKISFDSNLI